MDRPRQLAIKDSQVFGNLPNKVHSSQEDPSQETFTVPKWKPANWYPQNNFEYLFHHSRKFKAR